MDVQAVIIAKRKWQLFEELSLRGSEFTACPFNSNLGLDIKLFAQVVDRTVMVSEHPHCTIFAEVHDGLNRPLRVSAVTDIVAEEYASLCTKIACLRQTGAECLSIGVNVREYRNEHGGTPIIKLVERRRLVLTFVKWARWSKAMSAAGPNRPGQTTGAIGGHLRLLA